LRIIIQYEWCFFESREEEFSYEKKEIKCNKIVILRLMYEGEVLE